MNDPNSKKDNRTLYLEQIRVEIATNPPLRIKLQIGGNDVRTEHQEQAYIWTPLLTPEITHESKISVIIKSRRTVAGLSFAKLEDRVDTNGQEAMESFWQSTDLALNTTFGGQPATITLKLRPSHTLEVTREHVDKVQDHMKKYKPLMEGSTEQGINTFVQYGVVLAELNPISKMTFGLVKVTFDLLKEQNKYDNMVSDLGANIERILSFAERVLDDALCDESDLLEPLVKKIYDLIVRAATFICVYTQQSPANRIIKSPTLLDDRKRIEDLQADFKKLGEDLAQAVSGATLRSTSNIEKDLLLRRLNPIDKANYQMDRGCMGGTRTAIINDIVAWAVKPFVQNASPMNSNVDNMFWVYGMPGIGKTFLANSICRRLHESRNLGGSFFCRRDDPTLAEPKGLLPTLIYRLAGMFGPYRNVIAQALRDDPQLTPESSSGEILISSLEALRRHPLRPLVLVIDALDECGDSGSQQRLLARLSEACYRVKWLKIIITSRPEHRIKIFFERNGVPDQDLSAADGTHNDIRLFTKRRMDSVAARRYLPDGWPGDDRREDLIERSGGLFIFVETVGRFVDIQDPEEALTQILSGDSGGAHSELHKLYSAALTSKVGPRTDSFGKIVRVIVGVAGYRALRDETIASLMGLEVRVVKTWVDDLNSIIYRDESQNGVIRARHLSLLEFLVGSSCPQRLRVDKKQANAELAHYCLTTMIKELRFNICELETSYLPNSEIRELEDRVQKRISDALQYSCSYWSNHLTSDVEATKKETHEMVDAFFDGERPLYWLEVLSLMGIIPDGILALRLIRERNKKFEEKTQSLIEDTLRFVLTFTTPISTSAPHIYISALPFMPVGSILWQRVSRSFPKLLNVCKGLPNSWPARPHIWKGHTDMISSIKYSPSGQYVASGSRDGTIRIWDVSTGVSVGEPLSGHAGGVTSVAYSPDGRYIVSGSRDHTVRLWNAATGAPIGEPLTGHTKVVTCVAYSPDGHKIVSGSRDYMVRIWDIITGMPVGGPLTGHTDIVSSVAYSPDGQTLVSGSEDGTIQIWVASTGLPLGMSSAGHTRAVSSVAYSPDGHNIVSGSWDGTIRIWNAATHAVASAEYSPNGYNVVSGSWEEGIQIWNPATHVSVSDPSTGHTSWVTGVAYSPDGRNIVSSSDDRTIRIWDASTGVPVGEPLAGHTKAATCVAYSPDGRSIVSSSEDRMIRIWDALTRVPVGETLVGHTDIVNSVAYSPDGRSVVSSSSDATIRIWDTSTGMPVGKPLAGHTDTVASVTYSPDGRNIVSGSWDGTIRIWDAPTGASVGEPLAGHTSWVTGVAYSPDGRNIVSSSDDRTIRIWDATAGVPVGEPLTGHTSWVASVAYSPDGRNIISSSDDCTIRIWDASTGVSVGEPLTGHTETVTIVSYSPYGRRIVSASSDTTIRIWDASTGMPVDKILPRGVNTIVCVAYSPDGHNIAIGFVNGKIQIRNATTGAPVVKQLTGHTGPVSSVAYSPDGRNVVSGSHDHTIRIWDALTGVPGGGPLTGHATLVKSGVDSLGGHNIVSDSEGHTRRASYTEAFEHVLPDDGIVLHNSQAYFTHRFLTDVPEDVSFDNLVYPGVIAQHEMVYNGWVRCRKGLLFWVPDDCRHGLICPAVITIPTDGRHRRVRLEFANFKYGDSWSQVYKDT